MNLKINETQLKVNQIELRSKLFDRIPSATNTILLFTKIEDLILFLASRSIIDAGESLLNKFEKCKNLALGTKNFHERKSAVNMALRMAEKITQLNFNGVEKK